MSKKVKKEKKRATTEALLGQSHGAKRNYLDSFNTVRRPWTFELIHAYKRIIYTCANINAHAVAQVPLTLFVGTKKNQPKPKCETRPINGRTSKFLSRNEATRDYTKRFLEIEEVVEHPVLDLLKSPNEADGFGKFKLRALTQLYMEVTGKAYWHVIKGTFRPEALWILPSQYVKARTEPDSKNLIDYYEYTPAMTEQKFSPEEIIPFLFNSLHDPYRDGLSPAEAAWEDVRVSDLLIAHEAAMLYNEARPDAIVFPGDKEGIWDDDDIKRLDAMYQKKFARGGKGKWMIFDQPLKIEKLNWAPADIGRLNIDERARETICNAFDVPPSMLDAKNVNKATLEAAREQHALNGVKPRLEREVDVLNKELIPLYDNSGRLFFGYENPVPEDRAIKLQENLGLLQGGALTPNEVRDNYDYASVPEGDKLTPINVSPQLREQARNDGSAEK